MSVRCAAKSDREGSDGWVDGGWPTTEHPTAAQSAPAVALAQTVRCSHAPCRNVDLDDCHWPVCVTPGGRRRLSTGLT